MRIIYITASAPWGKGETFILEEMLEVKNQGVDLLIIPRNPPKEIFHKDAKELLKNSLWLPLIDLKIIFVFLYSFLIKKSSWKILSVLLKESRNYRIFFKNLAVLPKAVYVAGVIRKNNIGHIHCHWGATTATMAYAAAKIAGVPWSFTLHRWDIKENNMLAEKVRSAIFVRCISEHGKRELLAIIGKKYESKVAVIHMGVSVPSQVSMKNFRKGLFTIVVPANIIEVKGHKYLIDAIESLVRDGVKEFECLFYGNGILREKLANDVKKRRLDGFIKMPGALPHERLIELYKNGKIDCVVLPSITTSSGEHEGIPVALMEAMAYGVPVISTNTGTIPELLSGGAGILVKEKSGADLAKAIKTIMFDQEAANKMTQVARKKIEDDFNVEKNTRALLKLIYQ